MLSELITAEAAIMRVKTSALGQPLEKSSPFVCPYPDCGSFAQHAWGNVVSAGVNGQPVRTVSGHEAIVVAKCEACEREVIFKKGALIEPRASEAPPPQADMPKDVVLDFEEARQIYGSSPRGAAALLRLAIQKLCPLLGSTHREINAAIGELVVSGAISSLLQKALDTVRVIGNEAVHPGTLDLRDDRATALSLFRIVNLIVEKGISEPKQIDEIYRTLPPAKLDGIANRDKKK